MEVIAVRLAAASRSTMRIAAADCYYDKPFSFKLTVLAAGSCQKSHLDTVTKSDGESEFMNYATELRIQVRTVALNITAWLPNWRVVPWMVYRYCRNARSMARMAERDIDCDMRRGMHGSVFCAWNQVRCERPCTRGMQPLANSVDMRCHV